MTFRESLCVLGAGILAAVLASCGGDGPEGAITETRTVESLPKAPAPAATSAQRFGYEQTAAPPAPHGEVPATEAVDLPFTWTAPEDWQQAPDRAMRVVTYTAGPNQEVECYVAILGQGGGGVEANINRWRVQMGLEPLSEAEVAALPVLEVLGQPSPWAEMRGSFSSQFSDPIEDALMFGLVCPVEELSVFVKMTGPADVTAPQRDNFLAFCQSLTWSQTSEQ